MRTLILLALSTLQAAEYRTPAGTEPARKVDAGPGNILPGGRLLTPYGIRIATGPGPFGLAVSPSGNRVVTANGGPNRFSLTVVDRRAHTVRSLNVPRKGEAAEDPDDDWKSTFMGLAFEDEDTLYASEGEIGQVRIVNAASGKARGRLNLNGHGFADSYSGDLALDRERGILYVVDQANFRVVSFDARTRKYLGSARVGRLPFALALAPDCKRLYVTNVGMFSYKPLSSPLTFPPFGFPSKESLDGVMRDSPKGRIAVPGLGDPNVPESNSLCVLDVSDPAQAKVVQFIRTGLPFGRMSLGGSSPAGVLANGNQIFVSNSVNDSISVIDAPSLKITNVVPIQIRGLERYRGVLPIGMAYHAASNRLLVAEAGINAVGVIDLAARRVVAHIPAGWFPTRVALHGDSVFVTNAKGHGTGPNAGLAQQIDLRHGSLSEYPLPGVSELAKLTAEVIHNNGFVALPDAAPLPPGLTHVVIIVKENRTFDEVFGDISGTPQLARYGRSVTPNHHALAQRFAIGANFYADSEVSVDGHHWLVGSYPNVWTESTLMAAYGGAKQYRLTGDAPGRLEFPGSASSVHPEDQLEAGTIWHQLDRFHIPFRNFGEGFELAGVDEGPGLKPTGGRYSTNIPMPDPLYRNTSREYPNYNTNIPDQFRANQFIKEIGAKPLPRFLFIHLPNDHTADPRPADGYLTRASYVADNDYALGRIVERLSRTPEWRHMAIFITEDDAQGGVDHVDSHRTVLIVASPYAKKGYIATQNSSFPGLLKTAFRILGLPPLNLYDATATDLSECFTAKPDYSPFVLQPANPEVFDPANARDPLDPKPGAKMDDPREIKKQRR